MGQTKQTSDKTADDVKKEKMFNDFRKRLGLKDK